MFEALINDERSSDIRILVAGETLYAHKGIISCRCEELLTLDEAKGKNIHALQVANTEMSVKTLMLVLEFVYTGRTSLPRLQIMPYDYYDYKEVALLVLASIGLKLPRLQYLCEEWWENSLSMESVFSALKVVSESPLYNQYLKGICVQFTLKHYNEFISNKNGIYLLGIELCSETVAAFHVQPPPPTSAFAGNIPPDTIQDDFSKLFQLMPYADQSIVVHGENFTFHKAIVCQLSRNLYNDITTKNISINITASGLRAILKYCYCRSIPEDNDILTEMRSTLSHYNVSI